MIFFCFYLFLLFNFLLCCRIRKALFIEFEIQNDVSHRVIYNVRFKSATTTDGVHERLLLYSLSHCEWLTRITEKSFNSVNDSFHADF